MGLQPRSMRAASEDVADAAASRMLAENVKSVLERLRMMLISSSYEVDLFELLHEYIGEETKLFHRPQCQNNLKSSNETLV